MLVSRATTKRRSENEGLSTQVDQQEILKLEKQEEGQWKPAMAKPSASSDSDGPWAWWREAGAYLPGR